MKNNKEDDLIEEVNKEEIQDYDLFAELEKLENEEDDMYYSEDKYEVKYCGKIIGNYYLYKNSSTDKIWWVDNYDEKGMRLFTFDKQNYYSLFRDYQYGGMSAEEKKIFDSENPYWEEFFNPKNKK